MGKLRLWGWLVLLILLAVPVSAQETADSCVISADTLRAQVGNFAVTVGPDGMATLQLPPFLYQVACGLNGEVAAGISPSVPLNAVAPRPDNPDAVEATRGIAVVLADNLNLRSGGGIAYTVVGVLDGGTRAQVLGTNQARTWWLLEVDDLRGWASNEWIALRGDFRETPILPAEGVIQPPTFLFYSANFIYERPGNLDEWRVCRVTANIEHPIAGISVNQEWFLLDATCEDGRVASGWARNDWGAFRNPGGVTIPTVDTR